MIGLLPKTLNINGIDKRIRTDFRAILIVFDAINNAQLNNIEKVNILLSLFIDEIEEENYKEAIDKINIFIDYKREEYNFVCDIEKLNNNKKLFDWVQDENMIFSAINNIAKCEVREKEYMHWWTFIGYFNEIGESLFSTIIGIRIKIFNGKKLDKYEQEFYKKNKSLVNLKNRYSKEENDELKKLKNKIGW